MNRRPLHACVVITLVILGAAVVAIMHQARRALPHDTPETPTSTALHRAAEKGFLNSVRVQLEKGVDANVRDQFTMTPLHYAACEGRDDVAVLLLGAGALVNARGGRGWMPLHMAAAMGHPEMTRHLLRAGADPDVADDAGLTALHHAAAEGHPDVVGILLDHGASPGVGDRQGWTPLRHAMYEGQQAVSGLLLHRGAEASAPDGHEESGSPGDRPTAPLPPATTPRAHSAPALPAAPERSPAPQRVPSALPNVLLIVVDALRPDRLGCYGYARNTSPKLDALAAEGVVFTDVMAQGSSTITSVPLLLTGRRFGDAGMQQMRSDHLRGHARPGIEVPTLAELLREHGYETALVAASAVVGCAGGLDRGFDYFDFSCARIAEWNVSSASDVNLRACEWLESVHSGRCPFFLYLHYMEPHNHYRPPCEFCVFGRPGYTVRDTKRNVAMMDVVLDVLETGEGVTEELLSSNGMSLRDIERLSDLYDDEVLCMDHHLGQLFQRLRDVGIYENTLIIVTADHGEAFLEHGTLGHGQVLYQEVVHVPLIVRGPGIPHGAAVHDLVELVDVAPTILEAVGASLDGTMSGRSFYQALLGTGGVTDNTGIAELPAVMRAFRCGPLKLIVSPKGVEMYDLSEDPRETTNLASSRPEQADRLRGMLRELVQQRPAPLEVAEPVTPRKLEALKALGYIR